MSTTLDDLSAKGLLSLWEPDLGLRRRKFRRLYVTGGFAKWASGLPTQLTLASRLVSPAAELQDAAARFVSGQPIVTTMTRVDPPTGEGVLRLKTPSFGLLGWCAAPQTLVLSTGGDVSQTHKRGALKALGQKVVQERLSLGLDWYRGEFYVLFLAQC